MTVKVFCRCLVSIAAIAPAVLTAQLKLEKPAGPITATRMDTGPVPTGISVTGSPASATISWQPVQGAVSYKVVRTKADDPGCCRGESPALTSTTWVDKGPNDTGLQWSGSFVYTVTATQGNSTYGASSVTWQKPEPVNPTGLTAEQIGEGSVSLKWNAVPGASYWLFGPGANGSEGIRVDQPGLVLTGVPNGQHEWKLTSKYDPAGFLLAEPTWPRVALNVQKLSDNYRIVLNGVVVNSPTTDHALNVDGWGDELRFFGETLIFDRWLSAPTRKGRVRSPDVEANKGVIAPVYGDVKGFPNRIRAGSLTSTGGIGKGDVIPEGVDLAQPYAAPSPSQLPLLLWEGQLRNGHETLIINPSVGEIDDDNRNGFSAAVVYDQCPVDQVFDLRGVQMQLASKEILPPVIEPIREPPTCERSTEYEYGSVVTGPQNRPIGDYAGQNDPARFLRTGYFLVLTREKIENALGANSHAVVKMDRVDRVAGQNGNYTLYILIQRL